MFMKRATENAHREPILTAETLPATWQAHQIQNEPRELARVACCRFATGRGIERWGIDRVFLAARWTWPLPVSNRQHVAKPRWFNSSSLLPAIWRLRFFLACLLTPVLGAGAAD